MTRTAFDRQNADGSWAQGIDVWYLRLYYSVDELQVCRGAPPRPLMHLDPINSPTGLTTQLEADLYDDFTKTGVFNREETDETFTGVARMLFASPPMTCYHFDPGLKAALRNL